MVKNNEQMDSYSLAKIMGDLALSKKAENVVLLNMKGVSGFTDYFLICHGTGPLHVKAIYDAIENGLFDEGIKAWHREGYENKNWVLLDYVDVVCHVFDGESR
ncbi:MAG: ribosome silencing factor, partial [Candidatus Marinimicrobia bacterium]|nr:ribosome silencing factor [Candidatus Neomarinimicrobiota bacterium]